MKPIERQRQAIDRALNALYSWEYNVAMKMRPRDLEARYSVLFETVERLIADGAPRILVDEKTAMLHAVYDAAHARGLVQ